MRCRLKENLLGKLTDCCGIIEWIADALQRASCAVECGGAVVEAVFCRVAITHGIKINGDHSYLRFVEDQLPNSSATIDDALRASIGADMYANKFSR